ncbi:MAG: hypothetical protein ABH834_01600 [Candidatus Altiarchaeota archaeon]
MKPLVLLLAVVFFSGCVVGPVDSPEAGEKEFFPASEVSSVLTEFESSSYLKSVWNSACVFPLSGQGTSIVVAKVSWSGDDVSAQCVWQANVSGATEYASILLSEAASDIDVRWLSCGENPSFAAALREAILHPGLNLVHLGEGIPERVNGTAYVYIGKCHFWNDLYCRRASNRFCARDDSSAILSVAYAVFNPVSRRVHW